MKRTEFLPTWHAELTAIRRDLHAHPELAYQETRTADKVAELLSSWGLAVHRGLGVTGVVGTLRGQRDNGRAVGLRADMDALPLQEANTFAHASTHKGVMHACGHDGHTAMLLGAARHMAADPSFEGTVHFIFQPAEEGRNGARQMVEDGLFQLFPVEAVFGMHNWPGLDVGTFAVHAGPVMASSNSFDIVVRGKGAHAAMPHLGHDPVMATVQLAQAFQTIVSRDVDPMDPVVISVTQIHAGSANNIIPDDARLSGTVRTFSEAAIDLIEERMEQITRLTCAAMNCTAEFSFTRLDPPTINHAAEAAFCAQVLTELAGPGKVRQDLPASMGAEDFAYMLKARPGCYVWIGNGDGDHRSAGHGAGPCMLHNPSYDFNDALLPLGAAYWVELARRWLARP